MSYLRGAGLVELYRSHDSQFFGLLQAMLLAAVVVFSFFHGWRGVVMDLAPIELGKLGLVMALSPGSFARIARKAGLRYHVIFHGEWLLLIAVQDDGIGLA